MKIAVLYDSKFGNTKQLAEFLAEQLNTGGHEAKVFRTTESKPRDLVAFEPEVLIAGAPTHAWNPARTLGRYIKKIGKALKKGSKSIRKAAAFNCNNKTDVCHKIEKQLSNAIPDVEIHDKSLPVTALGMEGPLPENWKDLVTTFVSSLEHFLA